MTTSDSTSTPIVDPGPSLSDSNQNSGATVVKRVKHPGRTGRPTEYRPCLVKKLYDYFNGFTSDGTHVLPTMEHFGQLQKLSHQAFNEWRVSHPEFGAAYRNCMEIQKQWLTNGALSERYHPGFTKFLMINNHGMISDNAIQQVNSNANINVSGGIRIAWTDATSNQW